MANGQDAGTRPRRNKCEICGKTFGDAYALNYHKSVEHGPDKRSPSGVS